VRSLLTAYCEVDGDGKDCDLVFPLASAQDNITGFDQAPNQIPFFFHLVLSSRRDMLRSMFIGIK